MLHRAVLQCVEQVPQQRGVDVDVFAFRVLPRPRCEEHVGRVFSGERGCEALRRGEVRTDGPHTGSGNAAAGQGQDVPACFRKEGDEGGAGDAAGSDHQSGASMGRG